MTQILEGEGDDDAPRPITPAEYNERIHATFYGLEFRDSSVERQVGMSCQLYQVTGWKLFKKCNHTF